MTEVLAIIVGYVVGRMAGRRVSRANYDHELEVAYLTGHVDGWRKAEDEAWTEGLL
jgi:hypothetical protein